MARIGSGRSSPCRRPRAKAAGLPFPYTTGPPARPRPARQSVNLPARTLVGKALRGSQGETGTMTTTEARDRSPTVGPSKPRLLDVLGPGLITGASDDDPS